MSELDSYSPYELACKVFPVNEGQLLSFQLAVKESLAGDGGKFQYLGAAPLEGANNSKQIVMTCTHPALVEAVNTIEAKEKNGLAALGANIRTSFDLQADTLHVSHTSVEYWSYAAFGSHGRQYSSIVADVNKQLHSAIQHGVSRAASNLSPSPQVQNLYESYGCKSGLSSKTLSKYHYMIGMPYISDFSSLKTYSSHIVAINSIKEKLENKDSENRLAYSHAVNDHLHVFGVSLFGKNGEQKFLPTLNSATGAPYHTSALPYELFVYKGNAFSLHGRYRIALAWPDLTMTSFTKIMSTPGEIESCMKAVTQ